MLKEGNGIERIAKYKALAMLLRMHCNFQGSAIESNESRAPHSPKRACSLLVFIDESGDPGFKVGKGSSAVFVAAMVIFEQSSDAQATEAVIASLKSSLRLKTELKFNGCDPKIRDAFFDAVSQCPFAVRAIVVEKEKIYSPHLKTDRDDFYRFFVRKMIENDSGALQNANVVIDGSGDRSFRKNLASSLKRQVGSRLKSIKFRDSRSDLLIQLADMCVGAIARSYRQDRKDAHRWRSQLKPRLNDVWEFG